MKSHRLSVIMLAHNKADLTWRAVRAVTPELARLEGELVLVDQASSDGTPEVAIEAAEGKLPCQVVSLEQNLSFARAANLGARKASGEMLLFLDNDTEMLPGALYTLLAGLEADSRAAAIGPKLLWPSGQIQEAGLALPLWLIPVPVGTNARPDDHRFNFPKSAFAVSTTCLLIRRRIFEELKGFDEGYEWGFEAADLAIALRMRNLRVLYEPRACCLHEGGATLNERPQLIRTHENRQHFLGRWGVDLLRRVADYLDRLAEDGPNRFLIYGTGESGQHLAATLELGGYEVTGFLDGNGTRQVGVYPAWNVAEAPRAEASRVLIGSPYVREAEDELAGAGLLAGAALPILME